MARPQGFPSGQRGRAVNPLAQPSEVRILLPACAWTGLQSRHALLAQSVEHLHGKEGVDGSSPSEGSKIPANRDFCARTGTTEHLLTRRASMIADAQRARGNGLKRRPWELSAPRAGRSTIWGQILGTGKRPALTCGSSDELSGAPVQPDARGEVGERLRSSCRAAQDDVCVSVGPFSFSAYVRMGVAR